MRLYVLALTAGVALSVFALSATAQTPAADTAWVTAKELPNVDMTGLSEAQKTKALAALRKEGCVCGCQMKLAQCRVLDPVCSDSKKLSATVLEGVKSGKTPEQLHDSVANSTIAKTRASQNRILGDPIEIPVAGAPVLGPEKARITLVEFSDFECPYCSRAIFALSAILKAYPNDVKLIYKQFPLDMHPHARLAAAAALAAADQGKFWQMHDKLYANFNRLNKDLIANLAKESGLDMDRYQKDMASGKYETHIERDVNDGEQAGVQGTPTIFINGKRYNGQLNEAALKPIFEEELKQAPQVAQTR
jgi:protein-disulfide isomerase